MDGKPIGQHFSDEINAVVDKFRDQGITVGEVLGALEVLKWELIAEKLAPDADEDEG